MLCMSARAEGLLFTLRPGTVFSSQPGYAASDRLDFKPETVVVQGPALEQKGEFCLYTLLDRKQKPLTPDRVWIPCYSIDQLFTTP